MIRVPREETPRIRALPKPWPKIPYMIPKGFRITAAGMILDNHNTYCGNSYVANIEEWGNDYAKKHFRNKIAKKKRDVKAQEKQD